MVIGLENTEIMSKISIKSTLSKIIKLKLLGSLFSFKSNRPKVSIQKVNTNIIHKYCGTPNCCGQCETSERS